MCPSVYKPDPPRFYLAPNLNYEEMLMSINDQPELLEEIDMLLFFRGVRGGINGVGDLCWRQSSAGKET